MINLISGVDFSVLHGLAPVIVPVYGFYRGVASDKPLARIGPAHTLSVIHAQVTGKEHHIRKVNTILE